MRVLTSSRLTALGAALAVAASALPVSSLGSGVGSAVTQGTVAAAQTSALSIAPVSAGTLTLSTSHHKGIVKWGDLQQQFVSGPLGNCVLTPVAGTSALLDFVGHIGSISSSAGFKKGLIGVYEFKKQNGPPWNASQCDQVDGESFTSSEKLAIHLGSDAKDTFGPLVATKASLQLVASSKKGSAVATLVDAEGNVLSHKPISWSAKGAVNLTVHGEFSGILLKVTKGGLSLKAAAIDVASQADDFFCTEGSDDTFTNDDGVTVEFIGNADGSDCEGFGIKLGRDGDAQVHFIKPLDVNPEAQFIFTVPWDTIALIAPSMLPPVFIDFEESVPPQEHEMPYCPDYLFNAQGELVGLDGTSSQEDREALELLDLVDDSEGDLRTDGTQFACVGDREVDISKSSGPGFEATITDTIYLIGDARMLMR